MSSPQVVQLETSSLGNRSYVVVHGAGAIAVDPPRDTDRVEQVLAEHGATLELVVETHHHADYVSGGLALATAHGARYAVPGEVAFDHVAVADGTGLEAAGVTLRAVHTPGHTPHHLSYVLVADGTETAVFTGGSMLYGAVGRTDLVDPDLTVQLSHDQWHSVRGLADALPEPAEVLPTHGFGSFCSATPTTGTESTIGQQRSQNPACTTEEEPFVQSLLDGYDAFPAYYAQMPPRNVAGAAPIDLSPPPVADAAEVRRRLDAGEWVIDLRPRLEFAAGHVAGTYGFDASGSFSVYLGWMIPWGTPVTLLGETAEQVAEAQRELARIGIDRPAAAVVGGVDAWSAGDDVRSYRRVSFADLAKARTDEDVVVLDARRRMEWEEGHLEGARHIPLHELLDRLDEVPTDREVWVHCASGFRSSIASSVLDATGRDVVFVDGDFTEAAEAGMAIVRP